VKERTDDEYSEGRRYGVRDARNGEFRPQEFASEPADFRQGYIDGWTQAADGKVPYASAPDFS
jgi:hypothetical protein